MRLMALCLLAVVSACTNLDPTVVVTPAPDSGVPSGGLIVTQAEMTARVAATKRAPVTGTPATAGCGSVLLGGAGYCVGR